MKSKYLLLTASLLTLASCAKGEEIVLLKNLGGGSLIRLAPDGTEPSGVLREYYIYRAR